MKTVTLLAIALIAFGQAPTPQARPPRPPGTQSPASKARPKSETPQHYSADQVREGEVRFGSQCGFCHGKDAAGGETGPDLTRAELVAQDSQGDKLAPVIRAGRPNAGMPAFPSLTQSELNAIVAFLHTQMDKFAVWSTKTKLVVKRPPSPGDIHGVIRRAPTSSRYRNRRATCVCGRWPEYGPGWIPELQGPVRNAADRGCNGVSTLRRSFSGGAR